MELIVIALGGNAISKRNELLSIDNQYQNINSMPVIQACQPILSMC